MTPEELFLQAIIANPDDDAPRLMYADWLTEHGDPRGEFIRVQCELARQGVAADRLKQLRARERDLFRMYGTRWKAAFGSRVPNGAFSRGLLEFLAMPAREFVQRAEELFRLTPIRDVLLDRAGELDFPELFRSPLLGRLRGLGLRSKDWFAPLSRTTLDGLLTCPHLGSLQSLSFYEHCLDPGRTALLAESPILAKVQSLDLACNVVGPRGLAALGTSRHLTSLSALSLANCRLGEEAMAALSSPPFSNLSELELSCNELQDAGGVALVQSLASPSLATLRLGWNYLRESAIIAIAQSPKLANLRVLDLDDNPLTLPGVEALGRSAVLTRLEVLSLRRCELPQRVRDWLKIRFGSKVRW